MDPVTIVTATGGRPFAFSLCRKYVERQRYAGAIQWLVVDDGEPRVAGELECARLDVTRVFPEPKWSPGQNTLARNLMAAIPKIKHDKVIFCEDDDWVHDGYCDAMSRALDSADIAGEVPARYYHVPCRRYRVLANGAHASLCQTGIRSSLLPLLWRICSDDRAEFIDVRLWREAKGKKNLFFGEHVLGIKGLPGRPGIGIGHRPQGLGQLADPDFEVLRGFVGVNDSTAYEKGIWSR